jgi:hypothetical protein
LTVPKYPVCWRFLRWNTLFLTVPKYPVCWRFLRWNAALMRKQKALGLVMVSACDTRVERPRYPDLHKQYFTNTVEERGSTTYRS